MNFAKEMKESTKLAILLLVIFSLATPIGILIALPIDDSDTTTRSSLDGLASGSFFYVGKHTWTVT